MMEGFNKSMWAVPRFVLVYGFIMSCMYCILGFCSMMNVYRIINYLGAGICPTSFNHGKGSKISFHSCPKPHQVPFFKQGLGVEVWDTPWRAK
jgi:Pyruvate/2-oxoacid:ferredoxin oxidoreductase delta subunit